MSYWPTFTRLWTVSISEENIQNIRMTTWAFIYTQNSIFWGSTNSHKNTHYLLAVLRFWGLQTIYIVLQIPHQQHGWSEFKENYSNIVWRLFFFVVLLFGVFCLLGVFVCLVIFCLSVWVWLVSFGLVCFFLVALWCIPEQEHWSKLPFIVFS